MLQTHNHISTAAGMIATLTVALLAGTSARAQSPCADTYVMQPGDTLYHVTQQCRVELPDLKAANPQIDDVNDIAVGTRINIPDATGGNGAPPSQQTHLVEPGDTLFSLADRYGTSVDALLEGNPGLDINDLRVGLSVTIPTPVSGTPADPVNEQPISEEPVSEVPVIGNPIIEDPVAGRPTITVAPASGAPGAPVTVSGDNHMPGTSVQIGVGPPESEWQSLEWAQVQSDGQVAAQVQIPETADPGDDLVYVIQTRDWRTTVSSPVLVVDRRDPGAPGDNVGMRTETGQLARGVECLQLNAFDGRSYSLVGVGDRFDAGDYVRVTGETAEASFCMQGDATIEVDTITRARPGDNP